MRRQLTAAILACLVSAQALAGTAILTWTKPTGTCTTGQPLNLSGFKVYWGPVGRVLAGLPPTTLNGCGLDTTGVAPTNPKVPIAYPKAVIVIANPNATTINVTMPNDGQRYFFAISATDSVTGESFLSNEVSKLGVPGTTTATITWK